MAPRRYNGRASRTFDSSSFGLGTVILSILLLHFQHVLATGFIA